MDGKTNASLVILLLYWKLDAGGETFGNRKRKNFVAVVKNNSAGCVRVVLDGCGCKVWVGVGALRM